MREPERKEAEDLLFIGGFPGKFIYRPFSIGA